MATRAPGHDAWGQVRDHSKTLMRPRTSDQRNRPRRPQSPVSARPSTSNPRDRARPGTSGGGERTGSLSKFAQAAQKAVSIVNGGCLCRHPTLGKGGECENCKRKLPIIAQQQNFPLRSRSGSVQFGEAPPLPKANKAQSIGLVSGGSSQQENNRRPSTVDGRRRHPMQSPMVTEPPISSEQNRIGGCTSPQGCDGKEDKCPSCLNLETQQQQLDKTIQYKQEEISELRNSIDRLNSQVSYHIFSNTQLQQEVDKLKNSTDVAPSQPVKRTGDGELEKLKKQLKDANDQNIILVNQITKGGKNEAALKQVTEALKKAQVDLAACQGELQQYKQNSVVTKNAAEIENKLRKQIEGEKATNKKLQKELDEALKAMKKAKSDLDKSGKDAGSANDELSKLKSRLKDLEARIKELEADNKKAIGTIGERDKAITKHKDKEAQLLAEIEALKGKMAEAGAAAAADAGLKTELEKLKGDNDRLRMGEGMLKARIGALEVELAEARVLHKKNETEIKRAKAESKLLADKEERATATAERCKKELEELKASVARKEKDGKEADDKMMSKMQDQIKLLQETVDNLNKKNDKLEAELKKLQAEYDQECREKDAQEMELKASVKRGKETLSELEKERKEREKVVKEVEIRVKEVTSATQRAKQAEASLEATSKALKMSERSEKLSAAELKKLKEEMAAMAKQKDAMLEKANNALQRLKGQVLQMTCQGLLRLCVVAPRVTIAFEMKNINVAAVLPSGEIRAMLEKELLPKYTKVFLQQEENRGPENEEMEKWLQELLRDMETKIEQKLVSVLNDSMPSGSVVSSSKD